MAPLIPLVDEFFKAAPQTSLHLRREAAAGSWDALLSGRADLVIGAPVDGPPGVVHASSPLSRIRFVLALAPQHPLARFEGAIPNQELASHRSVGLGDTTRGLSHLQYGLLQNRTQLPGGAGYRGQAAGHPARHRVRLPAGAAGQARCPGRATGPAARRDTASAQPEHAGVAAGENGRGLRSWVERLSRLELAAPLFY